MKLNQIEEILKNSKKSLVIADEVYQEFVDPENKKSAIHLLNKHKNLIVIKSLSKVFGLAGIRFGFAIGHAKIIEPLEKWRLVFNINAITQKLTFAALDDLNHLKWVAVETARNRKKLFGEIKKIRKLKLGAESQTNVFLLKHTRKDLFKELLKRKILTADFRNCLGIKGKGFVRINIKTEKENQVLLKALKEIN